MIVKDRLPGARPWTVRASPRYRRCVRTTHLFRCWPEVAAGFRAARRIALFLDFDGTLASLRKRPEDVFLDGSTGHALARLARHRRIGVWIISGRRRADLRRRARVRGVKYLGLHGWEASARLNFRTPGVRRIRRAKPVLEHSLTSIPGIWVEDKGAALVVHHRGAKAADVRKARRIVHRLMKGFGPGLRRVGGKKIWEVLPREIHGKGETVRALLHREPPGTLAVYVGDDTSDEDAFSVLPDAVTVRVGRGRPTRARFRLNGPAEVRRFLQALQGEMTC